MKGHSNIKNIKTNYGKIDIFHKPNILTYFTLGLVFNRLLSLKGLHLILIVM